MADFKLGPNFSRFHVFFPREIWQNVVLAPQTHHPRGSTPPARKIFYPALRRLSDLETNVNQPISQKSQGPANQQIHICMTIGCCASTGIIWKGNSTGKESLILILGQIELQPRFFDQHIKHSQKLHRDLTHSMRTNWKCKEKEYQCPLFIFGNIYTHTTN